MLEFSRIFRGFGSALILTLGAYSMSASADTTSVNNAQINNVAVKTILVIGDSLSAEYGLVRGTGWVEIIRNEYLPSTQSNKTIATTTETINTIATDRHSQVRYKLINASISGDTTAGGLSRLPALLAKHPAQIVLLELGANDALRGLALEQSRQNLERIRDTIHAQGGIVVFIGMQIPPNFGPVYTQRFSQLFTEVKTEKDFLVPFLMEGFALDREKFQADGIHPNESAQAEIAKTIWPALERAINVLNKKNP